MPNKAVPHHTPLYHGTKHGTTRLQGLDLRSSHKLIKRCCMELFARWVASVATTGTRRSVPLPRRLSFSVSPDLYLPSPCGVRTSVCPSVRPIGARLRKFPRCTSFIVWAPGIGARQPDLIRSNPTQSDPNSFRSDPIRSDPIRSDPISIRSDPIR